ncbi:MAG: 1-acyl-sn-glycerol-3-phosphate acyltransferase [Ruminococcaceae bacterium]|nr:1-acyl-sn-glycerol-3-phosphate acyltransferase [Oscillospiraceae bacterium]
MRKNKKTIEKSPDRLEILKKIELHEKNGWFDIDVENDPPTRPLRAGECDYTLKKFSSKVSSEIANFCAKTFFDRLIRKGELIIEEVRGIENYRAVKGGAVITSNHFNPYEQYAVFKAIEKDLGRKRLYKVIREGNYTSFPGIYGYFFRHCNTLPLASSHTVLREFTSAFTELIARGEKILIYPEQAMWWNYKKPRPLKSGAFQLAVKANAPVIPFFITMRDSDRIGADGFPIQKYTVHILPAIYPDPNKKPRDAAEDMKNRNYEAWKALFEDVYGEKLTYNTSPEGI